MAGITAVYSVSNGERASRFLRRVLQADIRSIGTETVEKQFFEGRVRWGGVFPKHFRHATNPVVRGSSALFFYGQLYDYSAASHAPEFAFDIIERKGLEGISDLNGPFALFFWDGRTMTLVAATDRHGRVPVYFLEHDGIRGITTHLHSVIASGQVPVNLEQASLVDSLTVGFCLGSKSMFEGVRRMRGGQFLRVTRGGMSLSTYWQPTFNGTKDNLPEISELFASAARKTAQKDERTAVALSGGWDTRTTWAALKGQTPPPTAITIGEPGTSDVTVARAVCRRLNVNQLLIEPDVEFFASFRRLADSVMELGSGHVPIDFTAQLYAFEKLARQFATLVDSAGCEFRRGIRTKLALRRARSVSDVATHLLDVYASGIWNAEFINADFYQEHQKACADRLIQWSEEQPQQSNEGLVDVFHAEERWAHHYAHGFALQLALIPGYLPFYENGFYDEFLQSNIGIRWSHRLHETVISQFAPELRHLPISFGHCKVPYGGGLPSYVPVVYHRLLSRAVSILGWWWLRRLDNYKPFLPLNRWCLNQLKEYVHDMTHGQSSMLRPYINVQAVGKLLTTQQTSLYDFSNKLNILLTFSHLLRYEHRLKETRKT